MIRNQDQPVIGTASDFNDQKQWTLGARYTLAYSIRDEVAIHSEISSLMTKGVGFAGLDQRVNSVVLGVDFVY